MLLSRDGKGHGQEEELHEEEEDAGEKRGVHGS